MRNLAIIPARAGSKGLVDKNIRILSSKPLMAYSIEAALRSNVFDTVMVSTDSKKYAYIATEYGAEVPFLRSKRNSSDLASSWDMVSEVLDRYDKKGIDFNTVCILQPTSPLRTENDIIEAYNLFNRKKAKTVVSMVEIDHPLSWTRKIKTNGAIDGFNSDDEVGRRQDQDVYYRPNGAIYIVQTSEIKKDFNIYMPGAYAFIMPKERSIDIDTEFDFKLAEYFMNTQ